MGSFKKIFKAGIFGTILGGILGILFAPKPGKETRAELKEKAEDIKEKAGEVKEEVKETVEEMKKEWEKEE